MINKLKSILTKLGSSETDSPVALDTLRPARHLIVIGDIHGCAALLRDAFDRLDEGVLAAASHVDEVPHLVFVGDYVDRGEESADVLRLLFRMHCEMPDKVTCLMGNHERMMLDFIDDPAGRGTRWLRNGGLQTLASYQIGGVREQSDAEDLTEASHALEAAMPAGMLDWLRGLPLQYRSGNVCVVHAAMDPHLGPDDQSSNVLLWGHNEFMNTPREDDLWVVHGHTIVKEPLIRRSRISIDTGAYHSGRLTVAMIKPGLCNFV